MQIKLGVYATSHVTARLSFMSDSVCYSPHPLFLNSWCVHPSLLLYGSFFLLTLRAYRIATTGLLRLARYNIAHLEYHIFSEGGIQSCSVISITDSMGGNLTNKEKNRLGQTETNLLFSLLVPWLTALSVANKISLLFLYCKTWSTDH